MSVANVVVIGLWAVIAASVVARLSSRPLDARLAGMAAFYVAVPAFVLASQLAQVALLAALGAGLGRFETWIYWGSVEPAEGELEPLVRAGVAALGPCSLLALAAGAFAWTRARPASAAQNYLRLEVGRVLLLFAFGLHPIVSLLSGRGDLAVVRDALDAHQAGSGSFALLAYDAAGAWAFWRWRRAGALRLLASPLHDAVRLARARLAASPGDVDALRALGAAQLAAGDVAAVATLEAAAAGAPDDPRVALLLGRAHLEAGNPQAASQHLRRAGTLLTERGESGELLLEVMLSLAAARMALGDAEGALLTAEAACAQAPRDPRALVLAADALVAAERRSEARTRLEHALAYASGALEREIARRLAALERR